MKVSGGLTDGGVVVGNTYDKYGSRNVIVRWIMRGFHAALDGLVQSVAPKQIHEIGCGEGYWILQWIQQGIDARGSDFSPTVIALAVENAQARGVAAKHFKVRSIYDLKPGEDTADLVVCCEVLEHLEQPEAALEILARIANPYLIVSVPREPLWSVLNLARGKYLTRLGNTPGHIQQWSKRGFVKLVSRHFDLIDVKAPLPWTMLLCRRKGRAAGSP